MSTEQVKQFYAALSQDEPLRQKVAELFLRVQHQPVDALSAARWLEAEVLPLAAAHGFVFSLEELRRHEEALWRNGGELSEADLQGISGGLPGQFPPIPLPGLFQLLTGSPTAGLLP